MADETGEHAPAGEESRPVDPGPAPTADVPAEDATLEGGLAAALDEVAGALDSVMEEGDSAGGGPRATRPRVDDLPPERANREDEGDQAEDGSPGVPVRPGMAVDGREKGSQPGEESKGDESGSSPGRKPAPEGTAGVVEEPSLPDFADEGSWERGNDISMLGDVDLKVHIELGRAMMYVEDVLKLSEGSVVELENLAGDPVAVFVNDRLIAHGEVLVLNDNFCVRVSEIVTDPEHAAVG